ncbi:hypothetical protein I7I51_00181 [Histoplasma capsulatum]|uniref:Uncharacterized protein n=1 Tax=Ajellomyces capsulatus TaxID=5037 RepID=A0A8A1MER4_AJECA|nr:hypothetical protein I7I51_00181 [Histoplasma capsulatum]
MNNIDLDNELQQRLHDGHDFRETGSNLGTSMIAGTSITFLIQVGGLLRGGISPIMLVLVLALWVGVVMVMVMMVVVVGMNCSCQCMNMRHDYLSMQERMASD